MTVEGDVSLNIIIREACESDLSILIEYNRALAKETECCPGNEIQIRENEKIFVINFLTFNFSISKFFRKL